MVLVNKLAHAYDMGKKKTAEAVKNAVIEEVQTCQVRFKALAPAFVSLLSSESYGSLFLHLLSCSLI